MASREELSPAPVPSPLPAPLPFDLTWADLESALPGAAAGGRAVVSHVRRGRHQGGHPAVIMTLSYEARGGRPSRRTLFFKLNSHHAREAQHYRFLRDRGIPVPHLMVCVERDSAEVLGLEFLPSVGLGPADVDEVLRLVAALNSLTHVPDAVGRTRTGIPQAEFEHLLAGALDEVSTDLPDYAPATWLDTYRTAAVRYQNLPTALTHGELAAQQVGRTEDGRLVVFDLATLGRRPRLADIANLLATLADLAGTDERSILGEYLGRLSGTGGAASLDAHSWAELRLTRFVQEVEALPWRLSLQQPAELDRYLRQIASDERAALDQAGR